jgi:hypothetical protein
VTALLAVRLRAHGLPEAIPVVLHANRRVLVSMTRRGALRVHRGYEAAPDEVVAAIAKWARPRTRRTERRLAQRILVAFPVHQFCHPEEAQRPKGPPRPEDEATLARLTALHAELSTRHFGGTLGPCAIRLSRRMRRRLGEFRPPGGPGERPEIALAHRHLKRDGWARATGTLLHEMVHQWQAETSRALGHGKDFREKCAEVGIPGRAIARLGTDFRSYLTGEE